MARKNRFNPNFNLYLDLDGYRQPDKTPEDILLDILDTKGWTFFDPDFKSYSDEADDDVAEAVKKNEEQWRKLATNQIEQSLNLRERMPFVESFTSREHLSTYHRSNALIFDRRSKSSFERTELPLDSSYKTLFTRFINPFMKNVNDGDSLQKHTIAVSQTVLDLTPHPGKSSIHNAAYYRDKFQNLSDDTNIFSYDIETFGKHNIWQIGYYTNKGNQSLNRLLLPDQDQLALFKDISDKSFSRLSEEEKVIYTTLSNFGAAKNPFSRSVDENGYAYYQMNSYAKAAVTRENARLGLQKLQQLVTESQQDKTFTVGGHTLTSSQKSFLDTVGTIFQKDNTVLGHNIERFDTPNIIHQVSAIDGGWEYLQTLGLTREQFTKQSYIDTLDAIRSLSPKAYANFYERLTSDPRLHPETRVTANAFYPNSMEGFEALFGLNPEGGIAHAADFDSEMTMKLFGNPLFRNALNDALYESSMTTDDVRATAPLSVGQTLYAERGTSGLLDEGKGILVQENNTQSVLFQNGLNLGLNGQKTQRLQNGASIAKGQFQTIVSMETIDATKLSAEDRAAFEKAGGILDSNLVHIALSDRASLIDPANTDTITHIFGSPEYVTNLMNRMFTTDPSQITDESIRNIVENGMPEDQVLAAQKRILAQKNADRARRSYNSIAEYSMGKLDEISSIVDTFEDELSKKNIQAPKGAAMSLLLQNAVAVSQQVSIGKELTLSLQQNLNLTKQQTADMMDLLDSSAKRVVKALQIKGSANPGFIRNMLTTVGLGDNFKTYHDTYTKPIMQAVSDTFKAKNPNLINNPDFSSTYKQAYKDIMQAVQDQFASAYIEKFGGDPELTTFDDNLFRLDTKGQFTDVADVKSLGQGVVVNLNKRGAENELVKNIVKGYNYDVGYMAQSPSKQADLLARFVRENNDPALERLRKNIEEKPRLTEDEMSRIESILSGTNETEIENQLNVLGKHNSFIRKFAKSIEGLGLPDVQNQLDPLQQYIRTQRVFHGRYADPQRMAQLIIDELRDYRNNVDQNAGNVLKPAINLETIAKNPERTKQIIEQIMPEAKKRATDMAAHVIARKDDMIEQLSSAFIQDEESVRKALSAAYGGETRQAKHVFKLYQAAAAEMRLNIESLVNNANNTSLEYNPQRRQFIMRSNTQSVDLSDKLPQLRMRGGALVAHLGNQDFLVNAKYVYTNFGEQRVQFTTNVGDMFNIFPLRRRIANDPNTDEYQQVQGWLYSANKRMRSGGTAALEGTIQESKYNLSVDFKGAMGFMPTLAQDQRFLDTLSTADRDDFVKAFFTAYDRLPTETAKTRFMNKLDAGELTEDQRTIFTRILPDIQKQLNYMSQRRPGKYETDETGQGVNTRLDDAYEARMALLDVSKDLNIDYKNSMMQDSVYMTDHLNIGGEGFMKTARDIQNQVTRALYFSADAANRVFEQLGVKDVTIGNAVLSKAGNAMLNERTVEGQIYSTNMQVTELMGTKDVLSRKLDDFMDHVKEHGLDNFTDMYGNKIDEVFTQGAGAAERIAKAVDAVRMGTNIGEGGAVIDARLMDAIGVQNDFRIISMDKTLELFAKKDKTEQELKEINELNKLVPVLEKDENGNLHMRYTQGRYVGRNDPIAFKKGYAGAEQAVIQKQSGIVKLGVFNTANQLVSDEDVSKAVLDKAKELGIDIKTSEDFYDVLRRQLNDKYRLGMYNMAINNAGAMKMTSDFAEKAVTTQLVGRIGQFYGREVMDPLKALGLGNIDTSLRIEQFRDLQELKYNPYLVHLVNEAIRNGEVKGLDLKRKPIREIRNEEDWEHWVATHYTRENFKDIAAKLEDERYLTSKVFHAATGARHFTFQDFIHHNTTWQPVNQLIQDMVNYQVDAHGKSVAEANEAVYNALQGGKYKTFLSVDGKSSPLMLENGRLIVGDNFNLSLKGLSEASQTAFEDIARGKRKFVETMAGPAGRLNPPDEERLQARAAEIRAKNAKLTEDEAYTAARNEAFTSQDVLTFNVNGSPVMLDSSANGYLTRITVAPQHDITSARSLGNPFEEGYSEAANKGGTMTGRELSKLSIARRDATTIENARHLLVDQLNKPEEFLRIYGDSLENPKDVRSAIRADKINTSIAQPYIDEIKSHQFLSPEQAVLSQLPGSQFKDFQSMATYSGPMTARGQQVMELFAKEGFRPEDVSIQSFKTMNAGFDALMASRANNMNLSGDAVKDLESYGFIQQNIKDLPQVSGIDLAAHSKNNLFNQSMILDLTNDEIGMTRERLQALGGTTRVATAMMDIRPFGSQAVNDAVRVAGNKVLRLQSALYQDIKANGQTIEDTDETAELFRRRQQLEQQYAAATVELRDAQDAIATGKLSPLKSLTSVNMAHYIRPKAGVADMDLYSSTFAQHAQYRGMSLSEYVNKTGLHPDVLVISSEQARNMGILGERSQIGAKEYQKQLEFLQTHGIQGHVNRAPSNYEGSVTPAQIYVNDDIAASSQMVASTALARKMKMDVDGDTAAVIASQFMYKNKVYTQMDVERLKRNVNAVEYKNLTDEDKQAIYTKADAIQRFNDEYQIFQQTERNKIYEEGWDAVNAAESFINQSNKAILGADPNTLSDTERQARDTLLRHQEFIKSSTVKASDLTDADVEAFTKSVAAKLPAVKFAPNQDILKQSVSNMFTSEEAASLDKSYETMLRDNGLSKDDTDAIANWIAQEDRTPEQRNIYDRYTELQNTRKQYIAKTRQAAAGIVDLPVYRLSRMLQVAGEQVGPQEAKEFQNLFTTIQEGFLSPKNNGPEIDWKAVGELTEITKGMGRMPNGRVNTDAFVNLADWFDRNAAKAPGVRLTAAGKLDKGYYKNLITTELPKLFEANPGAFKDMGVFDQAFLSQRGIHNSSDIDSVLRLAYHPEMTGDQFKSSVMRIVGGMMTDSGRAEAGIMPGGPVNTRAHRGINMTPKLNNASEIASARSRRQSGDLLRSVAEHGSRIGAKKLIAGIVGGLGLAGYMGGNPSEDPNAEQKLQQQRPPAAQGQVVPNFSDASMMGQRGMSNAQGGYIVNIHAQTRQGREMAQAAINQATSNTFNQGDVNISMHMREDQQTTPQQVTNYIQAALA